MKRRGRRRGGLTTFKAGLIGVILLLVFTYLGFTKFANPFASQYTIKATFANANELRPGSLVRVAGVNVGTVQSVSPEPGCKPGKTAACSAAEVTMALQDMALPIHKDATFAIRPRIFLEGNFFVDIHPGSPSAPDAPSDYTFPVQQGTQPVQFDQVLSSLQSNTRYNLQILLQQYGRAVKKGGPAYNNAIQYFASAYQYSSLVAHDALGLQPHDLSGWIDKQGVTAGALDTHPQNLKNLVTDFNTTAAAFARQNVALEQAVAELPKTLGVAIPTFNALNSDFCAGAHVPNCAPGPLPKFAKALIPGVKSTGPMVDASLPFLSQLRQLVQPAELGGLTHDLSFTVPALAKLTVETIPFMKNQIRPSSSCVANVIYPWSQLTLNDPHFNGSNGFPPHKVYVEAVDFLPGLAGESRNFDANGPYIRILGALGQTGVTSVQSGLVGGTLSPLVGFEPTVPPGGHPPPLQPNVACETQPVVNDLSSGSNSAPSTATASTLPSSLGLLPLPLPLSSDKSGKNGSSSKSYKPASAQAMAAARKQLLKTGLFNIINRPQAAPKTSVQTSAKTSAKAKKANKAS
jgi:phospholipid/cholesterol/gamma-HCH transport system substrate-binding protein